MIGMDRKPNNKENLLIERQRILNMTDSELEEELERKWEEEDFATPGLKPEEKQWLTERISSRTSQKGSGAPTSPRPRWQRITLTVVKYAAVILLPLLACSTIYLYGLATRDIDCETIFTTDRGETASITLPDGSVVKMNNESSVAYNPYAFVKGSRQVDLDGEAFFQIASNPTHPFSVRAGNVEVCVLGTKFNVCSRADENFSSVYLEEGSVKLMADGSSYMLRPNQRAVINRLTGEVTIGEPERKDAAMAWINHEMVFSNEPLANVLRTIERCYGVEFEKSDLPLMPKDGFTGTLPSDDISMVLDALEDVYEKKFSIKGRKITLEK